MTQTPSNARRRRPLWALVCAVSALLAEDSLGASVEVGTTWIEGDCLIAPEGDDHVIAATAPSTDQSPVIPRLHEEGADAEHHRVFGRRLGVRRAHVVDPCDDGTADCCPALWRAHRALDASDRGEGRARIAVYGNSLIAADRIINIFRKRIQEQVGDGGQGLLFVSDMGALTTKDRSALRAEGWEVATIADLPVGAPVRNPIFGVGGSAHTSTARSQSSFRLRGETTLTVLGATRAALPRLEARIDGKAWAPIALSSIADAAPTTKLQPFLGRLQAPENSRSFELRAPRGGILHGVSFERTDRGTIVDNFGLVSAEAWSFLAAEENVMVGELDALNPDLVVIMLGGNEVKRLAKGRRSLENIRDDLRRFIRRVAHRGSESCLVIGPVDAVKGVADAPPGTDPFTPRPQFKRVNDAHRYAALLEGCAFIDLYEGMGGAHALRRFAEAGVLNDDMIHPLDRGLSVIGQLLADALLESWRASGVRFDGKKAPPACATSVVPTAVVATEGSEASAASSKLSSSSGPGPTRAGP